MITVTRVKHRSIKLILIGAVTAMLSACHFFSNETNTTTGSKSLKTSASTKFNISTRISGHKSVKLTDNLYVGTSENIGLFLYDKSGQILAETGGNYEGLDIRAIEQNVYALSVNKESSETELFTITSSKIELLSRLPLQQTRMNNVCLFQPNEHELQAILLTNDHNIEQRLLITEQEIVKDFTLIRKLPAPPNSVACAVNDKLKKLFIAEETAGLWAYPLDPEAELQRELVSVMKPHGLLEGEIKDVSILDDGQVLVSLPEMSQLLVLQLQAQTWQHLWIDLPTTSVPESASILANELVWFDKQTDSYQYTDVSLPHYNSIANTSALTQVKAKGQTTPVNHFGDAADDPAIWPNIDDPQQSLILGTDKSAGLYVYNLDGKVKQFIATGRVNNVDISHGFKWQNQTIDLAAASNRTNNSISLYAINRNATVAEIGEVKTSLPDVYGLCSYKSPISNNHYVFINDEGGKFEQYLISTENGNIKGKLVRAFSVPSQPEGCVADSRTQTLYLGEEAAGIWRVTAEPTNTDLELIINIDEKVLFDDVEGLSIYDSADKRYLVVSSQGSNSYVLYHLDDLSLAGTFKVGSNYKTGIDGASETDGLAVSSFSFNEDYPTGLLVVQDGRNVMPNKPQNFKLVSWQDIAGALKL